MITGVALLFALIVGVVTYRIGRNNGYRRGSDEGYQKGLKAGRNEPLDKIQGQIDQANADLKDTQAAITAATSQVNALDRTAAEKRAELERELRRLEPITIRLERIAKLKAKIAELEGEIPQLEASLKADGQKLRELEMHSAYRGHAPNSADAIRSPYAAQITALSGYMMSHRQEIADLKAQISTAYQFLTELIDDLNAKRAELSV